MNEAKSILIGNSFPLSLIRRPVRIEPRTLDQLESAATDSEVISFWGHANTLSPAEAYCGFSLEPSVDRPAIRIQENGLPSLVGQTFRECWILSAEYIPNYRPAVGEEVSADKITGWQILKITWE